MTDEDPGSRPELKLGSHLLPGVAAVALFAILAGVTLSASFGAAAGFPDTYTYNVTLGDADAVTVANDSVVRDGGDTFVVYRDKATNTTQQQYVAPDQDANVTFGVVGGDRVATVETETSVTASIAHTMFNTGRTGGIPGEAMLVAFEIIDVVLVAALAGAILLARKGTGSQVVAALSERRRDVRERVRGDGGRRMTDDSSPLETGGED